MLVADSYAGHREDADVAERLAEDDVVTVVLSDTERQRSRVRTETVKGEDVGIVVARDLGDGDVVETAGGDLVVVELAKIDALVLDVAGAGVSTTAALELGHALGNRHWDLALRDGEALFPVPDTRERMSEAVAELLPDGVDTRYERVAPTTFDDGDEHVHPHGHGADGHSHGDGDHSHSHGERGHGVRTIDGGEP